MIHSSDHCIPATHPSLPGHFPGNPIIPGVVLLEEVVTAIDNWLPGTCVLGFQSVKFLHPVEPGSRFSVKLELPGPGKIMFRCLCGNTLLNTGTVLVDSPQVPR